MTDSIENIIFNLANTFSTAGLSDSEISLVIMYRVQDALNYYFTISNVKNELDDEDESEVEEQSQEEEEEEEQSQVDDKTSDNESESEEPEQINIKIFRPGKPFKKSFDLTRERNRRIKRVRKLRAMSMYN